MGQLVLLVVAAAWAAVLVPPLLRSRIENRPNSSVSDFRDQLSSLQRAMPQRGVAMRSMGRPLAQSPLSRPAATGRPGVRATGRTHNGTTPPAVRLNGTPPAARRRPEPKTYDATPRARSHAGQTRRAVAPRRDAVKRRRANVLFVLALTVGCTLFLAATTGTQAMVWLAVLSIVALLGYVCLLGQMRQRDLQRELRQHHDVDDVRDLREAPAPAPVASRPRQRTTRAVEPAPAPARVARDPRRQAELRRRERHTGPVRRQSAAPRRPTADHWSHAV